MINVDVDVPVLGRSYYFQIDEESSVKDVTETIVHQIADAEQMNAVHPEQFRLAGGKNGWLLSPEASFAEYEIGSGSRLMLL